jgi:hypothetical protein
MHLSPEELIDSAEGGRAESAAPHLASCELCQRQVAELRSAISTALDVDTPEPSPLFWDHFSHRVREAVAAEETPRSAGNSWGTFIPGSWRAWALAGVTAAVMISIYATAPTSLAPSSADREAALPAPLEPFGAADDPSLAFVADLAGQIDPEVANEAGWTSHAGAVDEVVANLTEDERIELQRLLEEELAKS